MEPRALDFIDAGQRLDLPDLVLRLIEAGEQVGSHLFDGYWLDIGRHEDYEKAIVEYESLKDDFLPNGIGESRLPETPAR
jgi:NDP-sugar pyrophosphorylase family protein